MTGGRTSLGQAMIATLGGVLVYALTVVVVAFFLGAAVGPTALV